MSIVYVLSFHSNHQDIFYLGLGRGKWKGWKWEWVAEWEDGLNVTKKCLFKSKQKNSRQPKIQTSPSSETDESEADIVVEVIEGDFVVVKRAGKSRFFHYNAWIDIIDAGPWRAKNSAVARPFQGLFQTTVKHLIWCLFNLANL